MRAINASVMRQVNRTLILNRIRMRPISRAELAEETGLTRASVTQIVEELITDGMVIETSVVERSRLGRRSTQLAINPQAGVIFGVMLRSHGCSVGAVDMLGRVLVQNIEIMDGRDPADVLETIAELVEEQRQKIGVDRSRVFGVGVSMPGAKLSESVDSEFMDGWNDVRLWKDWQALTGLRVDLESTANALALEQKYFGGAGDHFALVMMEDALSVGVVVGDALYRGAPDFHVELGQWPVGPEGGQTLEQLLTADGRYDWRAMLENPLNPQNEQQLLQLSYPLAGAMCAYQVGCAIVGGQGAKKLLPLLPKLQQRVCELLPPTMRDSAKVTIAETEPVRMAATAVYDRIFSAG